ncbi:MAG: urea carboxylase-associated family protein [Aestuariivirga sp.]|nr:urea carboxylase-associated family protein [Aestuariivirga sp.]
MAESITLVARTGKALRLAQGQEIRVVNTHGRQVVDTWAFAAGDMAEFMSMEHSRVHMGRVNPVQGSVLLSNRRRAMLTIAEDTSGGVHDTLLAACDVHRYRMLGATGYHRNCTDNLAEALAELSLVPPETPSPLNLFQNSAIHPGGELEIVPPIAPPGSHVTLRAEMDLVIVFSACPQDMAPTNGADMMPKDAELQIA